MASIKDISELNKHMLSRSYVTGYSFSKDDSETFARLGAEALTGTTSNPHAYRWALHISALQGSVVKSATGGSSAAKAFVKPAAKAADDDFGDMFGDDEAPAAAAQASVYDEEEDEGATEEEKAASRARRERMAKAAAMKAEADAKKGTKKKEKEAEKSLVVLEVKPWEADTDLEMVWREILKFEKEGLTWGQSFKLEPVAYGIKKLVMTATIVDSLIVMDDITEAIEALEEYVQSVQVASMNKI